MPSWDELSEGEKIDRFVEALSYIEFTDAVRVLFEAASENGEVKFLNGLITEAQAEYREVEFE